MIYKGVLLYFQSQYLHNENFKLKLSFSRGILSRFFWSPCGGHICAVCGVLCPRANIIIFLAWGLDMFSLNLSLKLLSQVVGVKIISPIWSRPIISHTLSWPARNSSVITTCCQFFGIAGRIELTSKSSFVRRSVGAFSSNDCRSSRLSGELLPNLVNFGQVCLVWFGLPLVFKQSEQPFLSFSLVINVQVWGSWVHGCVFFFAQLIGEDWFPFGPYYSSPQIK